MTGVLSRQACFVSRESAMKPGIQIQSTESVHENTNQSRVLNASQAQVSCRKYSSQGEDSIRDLTADLLHYAHSKDFNAQEILRGAVGNWTAERCHPRCPPGLEGLISKRGSHSFR